MQILMIFFSNFFLNFFYIFLFKKIKLDKLLMMCDKSLWDGGINQWGRTFHCKSPLGALERLQGKGSTCSSISNASKIPPTSLFIKNKK